MARRTACAALLLAALPLADGLRLPVQLRRPRPTAPGHQAAASAALAAALVAATATADVGAALAVDSGAAPGPSGTALSVRVPTSTEPKLLDAAKTAFLDPAQFEKASRGVATIQLDGLGSFDVFTSIRPSDPASKQAPLLTVAPPTDLLGAAQALLVGRTLVDVNGVPLEVAFRVDEGIATIQLRQPLIPKVPLPYDGSVRQPSIAAVNRARALAGGMPVAPDQAPAAAKKAQQRAPLTIQELEDELEQEIETGNFFSLEPNTKVVLDELGDATWWRTPAFLGVAPETYGESLVGGVAAAYGLSYAVYVNDNKPKPKAAKPKPKPKPKPKAPDGDGGGGGGGEAAPAPKASAAPAGDEEKAAKKKAAPAAAKEAAPAPVAPPSAAAAGEAPLSKPLKVTSAAVSAAPAAAPAEEVTRWQRWVSGDWS